MRVLVTGVARALGQEIAAALVSDENAQLRLMYGRLRGGKMSNGSPPG